MQNRLFQASNGTLLFLGSYPKIRLYRTDQVLQLEGKKLTDISISILDSNKLHFLGYKTEGMSDFTFLSDEIITKIKVDINDAENIRKVNDNTEKSIQNLLNSIHKLMKDKNEKKDALEQRTTLS